MEAPKEAEGLKKFLGEWSMSIVFVMADGIVVKGKAIAKCELVSLGRGIHIVMKGEMESIGEYEEHDLVSFFKEDGKVHFFGVTSTDAVHDHIGNWVDDSTLVVDWRGLTSGKESWERTIFTWTSPDEMFVHEEDTVEGKVQMTAEYRGVRMGLKEPVPVPIAS